MANMNRADRARQFLPFNSLRGYYDLIKEAEREKTEKKILDEDELKKLADTFNELKRGMIVKITYYDVDSYKVIVGMIAKIDVIYRNITIVKTNIPFDDILDIIKEK